MADSFSLLEEDLSCSVCCEIFREPVILSCSHSFCRACLEESWSKGGTQDCPVCRRRSSRDQPPPNLGLRHACETLLREREPKDTPGPAKEPIEESAEESAKNATEGMVEEATGGLSQSENTSHRGPQGVCSLHSQKLQLFCLEDECLVCVECVLEHADHSFCSVGKAAGQRREGLRPQLKTLQEKMAAFNEAELTCDKMAAHIRVQTQRAERQIKEEFEKLHCFLREEEVERLAALKEEEEEKNKRIKERVDEISVIMSSLSDTIMAVEEKLAVDDVSFLQSYKTTMERTQSVPEDPQLGSRALINLAKHLGNLSFQVWEKMQKAVKYTPVVLDPNTAHPSFYLSEDLTSLRCEDKLQSLPDNPERFDIYRDILGSEGFTSGTHFWDVEVGESDDWRVGVASESVSRKPETDKESGLWAVGACNGEPYNMKKKTQRIRVSWDKCEVSFFGLSPYIHKLKTIQHKCTERMYPHFYLHDAQTLQILPGNISLKVENHTV
ncbi:zinc-binding protein A33 [Salmo salar]|uniref:Zinc-binding protein A33 n=1 Tax=Salmo salar TaxID=8030 RepID=A0A1S3QRC1_SALSA|nr:zinc-binding protein A33 [Salmo salar]